MKRIFLFAGYDSRCKVGPSLVYYVTSLSRYGDVVVFMDSDCPQEELGKLAPYVLHAEAARHHEYDFGSYKRAYLWTGRDRLAEYDVCYLVNDSVFGPLSDIGSCLEKMESSGAPAFSLVINPHRKDPHMQSWFMGFRPDVFLSDWFMGFLCSVRRQESKEMVCNLYETGLSSLLSEKGVGMQALFKVKGKRIYNDVRALYRKGLPFIKKSAFTRHNGSLGRQVRYVLDRCSPEAREAILQDARRMWGEKYVDALIEGSCLSMAGRYLAYLWSKI